MLKIPPGAQRDCGGVVIGETRNISARSESRHNASLQCLDDTVTVSEYELDLDTILVWGW